jgi:GTP cyclohydrolase II
MIKTPPEGDILTVDRAAQFLGVHQNTLRQWDKKGILKALRFGERKNRRYKKEDLEKFQNKGRAIDNGPVAATLPTILGNFTITTWHAEKGNEPAVLSTPHIDPELPVLVRIHSECMTGDALHSLRCDCGAQKDLALTEINTSKNGIFILLRQEGRGIGLYEKIKAYAIQEKGYDTFEANTLLGHEPDARDYQWVKKILDHFKVKKIRLLTNNPHKVSAVAALGINVVERVPLIAQPNIQNRDYIETKQKKFKHFFGEESNYFFQFSDIEYPSQVQEIGEWAKDKIHDPYLRICIGVSADEKTLSDELAIKNIAEIFTVTKHYAAFVPILHFTFRNSKNPVTTLDEIAKKLPFVEYIQLNDITSQYSQVLQKAVQHFLVDAPLSDETFHYIEDAKFVELIKNNKTFVCLDNSQGAGKAESFESYKKKIDRLLEKGISDIAVYGGFGPSKLKTYFQLKKYYKFNISIDAETHLKTKNRANNHLDIAKIKKYLAELLAGSN